MHEVPTQDEYPGGGNVLRHLRIRRGDVTVPADVVVTGEYEVGMQDQAFLGPESGLAVPAEDGGVDLYIATQWLHVDQRQVAESLGLPKEQVRLHLAGVGGAFGAREDVSMQTHACLLALRTGKPVKMVYSREESFYGHVHRHPATMRYEHGANRDGKLVYVKCEVVLDGGAYASSSPAVVSNAASFAVGPYECDNVAARRLRAVHEQPAVRRDARLRLGAGLLRPRVADGQARRGARPRPGRFPHPQRDDARARSCPPGKRFASAAPVAELLQRVKDAPMPQDFPTDVLDLRIMPGGVSNTTHGEGVRRGVGYAIGFKNVGFSEGFDDYSTARVRLELVGGEPVVTVHTAAAEVGQGLVTVLAQIARTELGIDRVVNHPADTTVGSAGSTSASRQTYCTGGAVKLACEAVRDELFARRRGRRAHRGRPGDRQRRRGGRVRRGAVGRRPGRAHPRVPPQAHRAADP